MSLKKLLAGLLVMLVLTAPGSVFSDDETEDPDELDVVIITATRIETPEKEVGSSTTVVTKEEIEVKKNATVYEVLRDVPGLDVVQSGGPGGKTSIFIRGAKSEHTLVLIDGVEVSDPIEPGKSYEFAHLTTDNIERIEIIRGPQSTLYGSDAIGGVINIITKKGNNDPGAYFSIESGSYKTFKEKFGMNVGNDKYYGSFAASHTKTDGISSLEINGRGGEEEDGYENFTASTRFGWEPNDTFNIDLNMRYADSESELDISGIDDPNYVSTAEEFSGGARVSLTLLEGRWEQMFGYGYSRHERYYDNDVDDNDPVSYIHSRFEGSISNYNWQNNFYLDENNTLIIGMGSDHEEGKSKSEADWGNDEFDKKTARTDAYYLQHQINIAGLSTVIGARRDTHNNFGTEDTWRAAMAYNIGQTNTKIKASYGTGFKAPSLYQLNVAFYGNPDLDPEKSIGWDAGVEQSFLDGKMILDVTYFNNEFEDFIDYDFSTWRYENVEEAESEGVELSLSVRPLDSLYINGSFVTTRTRDHETGKQLLRRPKEKWNVDVNYQFNEKGSINVGMNHVGRRLDWGGEYIDKYLVYDAALFYNINDSIQVFARGENLLDEDYEEVTGYGTPGASGYGGIKISL
jgi:vitamin B12 transporter